MIIAGSSCSNGSPRPAEFEVDVVIDAVDPPLTLRPVDAERVMLRFPTAGPAVVGAFLVGGPDLHSGGTYRSRTVVVLSQGAADIALHGVDFELYYEDAKIGSGRVLE